MIVYGYWRSSAAYRLRIALAWKGLAAEPREVDLRTGAQHDPAFLALNPQGRVPFLIDGELNLGQSLAIIEYLEEKHPEAPRLLPASPAARAHVRAATQIIGCDIHPLGNLAVLRRLTSQFGADQAATDAWSAHWIAQGFIALETLAAAQGPYLLGDAVTLADVCLVPQMFNARRFRVDLAPYPRLVAADAALAALPAFAAAHPDRQPGAA